MEAFVNEKIRRVAQTIGKASNARKVLLFGSRARGEATGESDVDFLVIADSELPRYKRSRELYLLFDPYPFAMDIIVYTPQEIEDGLKSPVSFISEVLREGIELYAA